MDQVFAYKLLMNVVQVINLALVWWLLGRVMPGKPRARLAAFVLFAWNPLMLFDAAGNAHNDALMVTLVLLGIAPLVARRQQPTNVSWVLGTFFVGLSALIKYTTGLVGLFFIVPWARRLPNWPARLLLDRRGGCADRGSHPGPVHPLVRLSARIRAAPGRRARQNVDVHQLGA